jgi:hypothetical protein
MLEPPGYRSFLVRLWCEPGGEGDGRWRGEAEHIQSGRSWRFASLEALLALLRAAIRAPEAGAPPEAPAAEEP